MVELIPKGAAYADGQKDILHELDSVFSGKGTLRVSDFLPYVDYSLDLPDYETVVAAVPGAGDDVAAVLYRRTRSMRRSSAQSAGVRTVERTGSWSRSSTKGASTTTPEAVPSGTESSSTIDGASLRHA
jgi:hypothetical protein